MNTKKPKRNTIDSMGLLYEKSACIVATCAKYKRDAMDVLDTLLRYVTFHSDNLESESESILLDKVEAVCTILEQDLSPLSTVERIAKDCKRYNQLGYVSSSSISHLLAKTDELAHVFMVLDLPLVEVREELARAFELSKIPRKATGSIPSHTTLLNRIDKLALQSGRLSNALYDVTLELATLRVAIHKDPGGADATYKKRQRRLASIRQEVSATLFK